MVSIQIANSELAHVEYYYAHVHVCAMWFTSVQVEEYGQQLGLSAKDLDSPRGHDDHHHHSPRHTSTSSHPHNHNGKNDSQCEFLYGLHYVIVCGKMVASSPGSPLYVCNYVDL